MMMISFPFKYNSRGMDSNSRLLGKRYVLITAELRSCWRFSYLFVHLLIGLYIFEHFTCCHCSKYKDVRFFKELEIDFGSYIF